MGDPIEFIGPPHPVVCRLSKQSRRVPQCSAFAFLPSTFALQLQLQDKTNPRIAIAQLAYRHL
jgi:hypothetical protein